MDENKPDQHFNEIVDVATTPPQIVEIMGLLGQASAKFEPESPETWRWMAAHAPNQEVADLLLRDLTMTMLRILSAVGQGEPVNGITISRETGIPKGTVSKSTRRLLDQGLITQEALPNNRKEILFRLTPLGRQLVDVHHQFDVEMARGFTAFLNQYNPDELAIVIRMLGDLLTTSLLAEPDPEALTR